MSLVSRLNDLIGGTPTKKIDVQATIDKATNRNQGNQSRVPTPDVRKKALIQTMPTRYRKPSSGIGVGP